MMSIFTIVANGNAAAPATILDYYRLLDRSQLSGDKFVFYNDKGSWQAKSPATDEKLNPVVDIPGGYIQVSDPGTGGGTYVQETALFITRSGAAYLGVNEKSFNGAYFERRIRFYRHEKGKLVVADSVLPVIEAGVFFKSGFDAATAAKKVQIEYTLPRKGTTVVAAADLMLLEREAAGDDYPGDVKQRSAEALRNIRYRKIELRWDADKGRFSIGRKIP